jgi:molybdopterin converting factor subunit 1
MQVHVRYFAVLRERRGRDEEQIDVPDGTTVSALYATLFPPGPAGALPVAFAVDHARVRPDHVLAPGAEVAFLPPLGGG